MPWLTSAQQDQRSKCQAIGARTSISDQARCRTVDSPDAMCWISREMDMMRTNSTDCSLRPVKNKQIIIKNTSSWFACFGLARGDCEGFCLSSKDSYVYADVAADLAINDAVSHLIYFGSAKRQLEAAVAAKCRTSAKYGSSPVSSLPFSFTPSPLTFWVSAEGHCRILRNQSLS